MNAFIMAAIMILQISVALCLVYIFNPSNELFTVIITMISVISIISFSLIVVGLHK